MSIILETEISPISEIYKKNINQLNFKDVCSLIFYATHNMAEKNSSWKIFYQEFQQEIILQNKNKCPNLTAITNNYSRRIEVYCDKGFITSKNFLTLLLRLVYIENRKKPEKIYAYHKVLDYLTTIDNFDSISKLSIDELFQLLRKYLEYYLKVYNDEFMFEYQLALCIMNELDI